MALDETVLAQDYLEDLLTQAGGVGPKVGRIDEETAEQRIRFEISKVEGEKQQAGLWSIHTTLKGHDVPPGVRLHLISAVVNLSLLAAERRPLR